MFADNCLMDSPRLERALRLKTNSFRGRSYENVYFTSVTVGQVAEAVIEVDFFYPEYAIRDGRGGGFQPLVKNVTDLQLDDVKRNGKEMTR